MKVMKSRKGKSNIARGLASFNPPCAAFPNDINFTMAFMKVMKSRKGKSNIARGRGAKSRVFKGSKSKTGGGLVKSDLKKNKSGKIVSRAASDRAKKSFVKNGLKAWSDAIKGARKALGLKGFVAIKGKSAQGKALYTKAKELMK